MLPMDIQNIMKMACLIVNHLNMNMIIVLKFGSKWVNMFFIQQKWRTVFILFITMK